jgi:hypothetical protein
LNVWNWIIEMKFTLKFPKATKKRINNTVTKGATLKYFFFSTGIWTQGLSLLGKCSTIWAMPLFWRILICYWKRWRDVNWFYLKFVITLWGNLQNFIPTAFLTDNNFHTWLAKSNKVKVK